MTCSVVYPRNVDTGMQNLLQLAPVLLTSGSDQLQVVAMGAILQSQAKSGHVEDSLLCIIPDLSAEEKKEGR